MNMVGRRGVYHLGKQGTVLETSAPSLYRMHLWQPSILSKLTQEHPNPQLLVSDDVCVLRVPFDGGNGGIIYTWLGAESSTELQQCVLNTVKASTVWGEGFSIQHVNQGQEPVNFFWSALGVTDPDSVDNMSTPSITQSRVFGCSADVGHFCVTELTEHFCQDDLRDESCKRRGE
jgi:hypothetical protein